jgi:hypothetical protein
MPWKALPPLARSRRKRNRPASIGRRHITPFPCIAICSICKGGESPSTLAQGDATTLHQSSCESLPSSSVPQTLLYQADRPRGSESHQNIASVSCIEESPKLSGAGWTGVFNELKSVTKIRHYSTATLRTYSGWTRKLQPFTKRKDQRLGGGHAQWRPGGDKADIEAGIAMATVIVRATIG